MVGRLYRLQLQSGQDWSFKFYRGSLPNATFGPGKKSHKPNFALAIYLANAFFGHSCLLWTQKPHVYWWTQKIVQGPLKDTRFWVHQKKWGFRRGKKSETWVFWVHQKTWGFKRGRVHQKTWGFWVHQKTWGFMRGNTKMGPSKHMRFLVHQMKRGLKFCIKFVWVHQWRFFDGVTGGAGA